MTTEERLTQLEARLAQAEARIAYLETCQHAPIYVLPPEPFTWPYVGTTCESPGSHMRFYGR